jgi:hypothetical protein
VHFNQDERDRPLRVAAQRFLLSFLGLAVIYANLSVIFNSPLQSIRIRALPLSTAGHNAFLIFGVFSYFETNNEELTVWGLATDAGNNKAAWKQLPTWEYLPFCRGNQDSRLWASRQYNSPNREGHQQAWQFMGRRIMERYNALHPNDPIQRVGFQYVGWPRSEDGFYALQDSDTTNRQFWVVAEK